MAKKKATKKAAKKATKKATKKKATKKKQFFSILIKGFLKPSAKSEGFLFSPKENS